MQMMVLSCRIEVERDDEAGVWVGTSEDCPGLTIEHANLADLEKMAAELVPILLQDAQQIAVDAKKLKSFRLTPISKPGW